MLDAYIIDRIRREREQQRKDSGVPLRIEREPPAPQPRPPTADERDDDSGGTVVDYRL